MRCNQIFYFCSFYKKFLCSENLPWSLTWVDPIHFFIKLILKNLSLCSAPNMELGFLLHVYLVPWDILISFDCNCLFTWLCFIFLTCHFSFINNKILRGRILAKIFLSSTTKLLLSFFSLGLLFFFLFLIIFYYYSLTVVPTFSPSPSFAHPTPNSQSISTLLSMPMGHSYMFFD